MGDRGTTNRCPGCARVPRRKLHKFERCTDGRPGKVFICARGYSPRLTATTHHSSSGVCVEMGMSAVGMHLKQMQCSGGAVRCFGLIMGTALTRLQLAPCVDGA